MDKSPHQNKSLQRRPKPRQLKRQQLQELTQRDQPQPEPRLEPVAWKPMG